MAGRLKHWARVVKRDVCALYLASRDPHIHWSVKLLAVAVAGYAVSPIDLITISCCPKRSSTTSPSRFSATPTTTT